MEIIKCYCKCGCGQEVNKDKRFISGHNTRLNNPMKLYAKQQLLNIETKPQTYCFCDCGEITNPGRVYVYKHAWNRGLSKENCQSLKIGGLKGGKTKKEKYRKGELKIWSIGKHYHVKLHVDVNCGYCHKVIDLYPYQTKKTVKHFCNRQCFTNWLKLGNSSFAQGKGFKPSSLSKEEFEKWKTKMKLGWKKVGEFRKNKTYDQIYGLERALEEKLKRLRKGKTNNHYNKHNYLTCNCCICRAKRGYGFTHSKHTTFMGISFWSKAECEVAKMFFKYLGIIPIVNINNHILVGTRAIDFYFYGMFIEFHPMSGLYETRKREEYYNDRRKILDDNGYKDYFLIHLDNNKEVKLFIKFLRDNVLSIENINYGEKYDI